MATESTYKDKRLNLAHSSGGSSAYVIGPVTLGLLQGNMVEVRGKAKNTSQPGSKKEVETLALESPVGHGYCDLRTSF
jgi:hypothetical protein